MKLNTPLRWSVILLALAAAWLASRCVSAGDDRAEPQRPAASTEPTPHIVFQDGQWIRMDRRERVRALMHDLARRPVGLLRISGTVRDTDGGEPVPGAEVVFASHLGESSTLADDAGAYTIEVPPGLYRAFARADGYVAVGTAGFERVPMAPDPSHVGLPRDEIAPLLGVFRDQAGVDMHLRAGAMIVGTVHDAAGQPVSGAVITGQLSGRASLRTRLVLGTDMDESDLDGGFRLEVPAGSIELTVMHHDFAGLSGSSPRSLYLAPGQTQRVDLTLSAGCIVTGEVVDARGRRVGDGSFEQWHGGEPPNDFYPVGAITAGRFRYARTEPGPVRLRAWPWKSPPSVARDLHCDDGVRHDITFVVPDAEPDLEGVVLSHDGQLLAHAFVDLFPLEPGGMAQQERADSRGDWAFYAVPPGRYRVAAYVPGHGAAARTVDAPARGVRLRLSGTGSINGAAPGVHSGSFTLVIERCQFPVEDGGMVVFDEISMPQTTRLVPIEHGTFRIDDLPACLMRARVRTPSRTERIQIHIEAGNSVPLTLSAGAD